jgi:ankyrin repeat protein
MDSETYNYIFNGDLNTPYTFSSSSPARNMTVLMRLVQKTLQYPHLNSFIDLCTKEEINKANSLGWTALHIACDGTGSVTNISTVYKLIEKGADIMAINNNHTNMLHFAACSGNIELVSYFIDKGFNVNSKNKCSFTTAHFLCRFYRNPENAIEILRLLLDKGADFNCISGENKNLLHMLAQNININLQTTQFLIDNKVNINKLTVHGNSPLCMAINNIEEHNNISIIEMLLENGADLNIDASFLHACDKKDSTIIKLLVKYKLSINRIINGETGLNRAISKNNLETVEILLNAGADPNVKNVSGKCALEIALETHKNIEILKLLLKLTNKNTVTNYVMELANNLITPNTTVDHPICVICFTKTPIFCTSTCHHVLYCENCFVEAYTLKFCPVCRKNVGDYFRVFF